MLVEQARVMSLEVEQKVSAANKFAEEVRGQGSSGASCQGRWRAWQGPGRGMQAETTPDGAVHARTHAGRCGEGEGEHRECGGAGGGRRVRHHCRRGRLWITDAAAIAPAAAYGVLNAHTASGFVCRRYCKHPHARLLCCVCACRCRRCRRAARTTWRRQSRWLPRRRRRSTR